MKKRKAYNKMKQLTRVADHLLKNVLIGYTDSLKGCVVFNIKQGRIIPPESREGKQVIAALGRPHTWSCYCAAFGRTQLGEQYMKSSVVVTETRYFQEDLAPVFEEEHAQLIKAVPDHHRCAIGWIASPQGVEFTEKEAESIFSALGVWE